MADVKATRVRDVDHQSAPPGSFEFYVKRDGKIAGMIYQCPCGCRRTGVLEFRPSDPAHPSWEWNGNEESPTLSPSVHDIPQGVTHWHGWLQGGVWRSC